MLPVVAAPPIASWSPRCSGLQILKRLWGHMTSGRIAGICMGGRFLSRWQEGVSTFSYVSRCKIGVTLSPASTEVSSLKGILMRMDVPFQGAKLVFLFSQHPTKSIKGDITRLS